MRGIPPARPGGPGVRPTPPTLYQAMFERGSLGQLIVEFATFTIIQVNPALCAMTGFSAGELVGSNVAVLFSRGQSPAANTAERLADGAVDGYSVDRSLRRRDGTIVPVLSTVSAVRGEDGKPVHILVVMQDISRQRAAEEDRRRADERALFASQHDPLTGLPERSALIAHLDALAASGRGAGALLLLDLDDFNLINDSLGHDVGNAVLLEVGRRVAAAFPGLMVARYGGDEFAVVAPLAVERAEAVEAAQRAQAILETDVEFEGHSLRVSASVGLALEQANAPSSSLVRNADSALSHAKAAGTGQYRLYDDDMRRQVKHRLALQAGLRMALGRHQLHPVYQPIVDLVDRRVVGFEALLRWTHPLWGAVAPTEFIPIAERSGLIVPIGEWVMNTACEDVLPIQRAGGGYVAVNVSARQLIGGGFAEWVEDVLDRTGLPPAALTVEVTESVFMDDIGPIRAAFDRLRGLGVRLSIDDFGTGYSSLARLQELPVDVIKLDRAFVARVGGRPEARGMAAAILQLSDAIGAQTIAEGIETEAEAAALLGLGYTMGQGYLFAQPMPIADLTAWLASTAPSPRLRVEPALSADPRRRRRGSDAGRDGDSGIPQPRPHHRRKRHAS